MPFVAPLPLVAPDVNNLDKDALLALIIKERGERASELAAAKDAETRLAAAAQDAEARVAAAAKDADGRVAAVDAARLAESARLEALLMAERAASANAGGSDVSLLPVGAGGAPPPCWRWWSCSPCRRADFFELHEGAVAEDGGQGCAQVCVSHVPLPQGSAPVDRSRQYIRRSAHGGAQVPELAEDLPTL